MRLIASLLICLTALPAFAANLTIYGNSQGGDGYAWVTEERSIELRDGQTTLTLENLPREVEADSVKLSALKNDFRVAQQQFRFDLVNQDALLNRFLGQNVVVERVIGDSIKREEGALVSEAPLMIKKSDGSVLSFNQYDAVHFPKLPEGLALEPSLIATLESERGGRAQAELVYQSRGFGWWMDYTLKMDEGKGELDATLHATNNSGRDFTDASLSVVAGNVQPPASPRPQMMKAMRAAAPMAEMAADASYGGVANAAVGDVHRYDVPGKASLPNNTTTELPFFAKKITLPVEKRYRFQGGNDYGGGYYLDRQFGLEDRKEVETRIVFTNSEKSGLGMSLPDGRMRVFASGGGKTSFVGETRLNRLSPEEKAELPLGTAFDITAKRVQEEYEIDQARKTLKETIRVTFNNRSKQDITIDAEEVLYRSQNAQVIEKTQDFEKIDHNKIRFPVKVKAGGEASVRYTVRYTWQ